MRDPKISVLSPDFLGRPLTTFEPVEWGGGLFGYCRDKGGALNQLLNHHWHHHLTTTSPGFIFNTLNVTEIEELASERSPPLGGGVDPAEKFGARVRFRERIDLSPQPVTRAENRLEQVVEVA